MSIVESSVTPVAIVEHDLDGRSGADDLKTAAHVSRRTVAPHRPRRPSDQHNAVGR